MTTDALGQSLSVKMPAVLGDRPMAAEAVIELEQRPAVRFMAHAALILHRPICRKGLPFERHRRMAAQTGILFGLESVAGVFGHEFVAGGTV